MTVVGLTGPALGNALTQLSGEHATGMQPASFMSIGAVPQPDARSVRDGPRRRPRLGDGFCTAAARAEAEAEAAFAAALPVKAAPLAPSLAAALDRVGLGLSAGATAPMAIPLSWAATT